MHDIDTTRLEVNAPAASGENFEYLEEHETDLEIELDEALSEEEELELATELLAVRVKRNWISSLASSLRKPGKESENRQGGGKVAKPFSGVLKGIAKKALPFVGGALGSFIPIPGSAPRSAPRWAARSAKRWSSSWKGRP